MGILVLFAVALGLLIFLGALAIAHTLMHPPRKTMAVALARQLAVDPADIGCDFVEHTFALSDGAESPGWVVEGADHDGPLVVFTHGWADSRYGALTWLPVLLPLAARLVVYDMRGHGDSTAALSRLGPPEARDLLAVADQASALEPADIAARRPLILWGHSMGAGVSLAAAALDAEQGVARVAAVVADGVSRTLQVPVCNLVKTHRLPARPLVDLAMLLIALRLGRDEHRSDRTRAAAALRCPLLVLHGDADPICPVAGARAVAQAAPNGRLELFKDAGHGDLAERDPERYRALVRELLGRIGAATA
jgi:pimeloyl-ACP methyl ester carboxylesterase